MLCALAQGHVVEHILPRILECSQRLEAAQGLSAPGDILARFAVGKAAYQFCLSPSLSCHNNHAIFMF